MLGRLKTLHSNLRQEFYSHYYARRMNAIGRSFRVQGPCHIHGGGQFEVGNDVLIRSLSCKPVELYSAKGALLTLDDNCFVNQGAHIACTRYVYIGKHCLIADDALIMDSDFHGIGIEAAKAMPVIIEDGAWVGARAIILKGVTIGAGTIVGAGAVVTRSVPPHSLVAGNPARLVRHLE